MNGFLPYNPAAFDGGATSWAAQGRCSVCADHRPAAWMRKDGGNRTLAYCEECKKRLAPEMSEEEKKRLWRICYESKSGRGVQPSDTRFLEEMLKKYPQEYEKVHGDAATQAVKDANPFNW